MILLSGATALCDSELMAAWMNHQWRQFQFPNPQGKNEALIYAQSQKKSSAVTHCSAGQKFIENRHRGGIEPLGRQPSPDLKSGPSASQAHCGRENCLESPGIDPGASRMLSERSAIWASLPLSDKPGETDVFRAFCYVLIWGSSLIA